MLNLQEINEKLETLPSLIARTVEEAENARLKYEEMKNIFALEEAKELLSQKAANSKLTKSELDALVELAVNHLRLNVVLAESVWKKLIIKAEEYDNLFTAVKKIVALKLQEMQSLMTGGVN